MQQLGERPSTSVGEVLERTLELRLVGGRLALEKAKHRSVGLLQRKEAVEGRDHHTPRIIITSQHVSGQVLDRVKLSLCERVAETTLVAEVAMGGGFGHPGLGGGGSLAGAGPSRREGGGARMERSPPPLGATSLDGLARDATPV